MPTLPSHAIDAPATSPYADGPRLGATVALCALLMALLLGLVGRLTQGFERWTFEALRREAALQGALHTPPMRLRDARDQPLMRFQAGSPRAAPVYVVDFIDTRCPSVCQTLGSEFQRMQEALRSSVVPVQLLSVSIAPAQDDAAALARYGIQHRADPRFWTLAAPQFEAEGREARRALGVVAIADGLGSTVHNGSIHLIDATGRVHGIYDNEAWPQALVAAQRLAASLQAAAPPADGPR